MVYVKQDANGTLRYMMHMSSWGSHDVNLIGAFTQGAPTLPSPCQ